MLTPRLASAIDFLTLERAKVYALISMGIMCFFVLSTLFDEPERLKTDSDFPAFYNAGRIINEYPQGSLYKPELQRQLHIELAHTDDVRYFAYTPFFALLFAPISHLPYIPALICWAVLSLALFTAGFWLAWSASGLRVGYRTDAFLISLSFLPLLLWGLLSVQSAAFGFFALALAIYLDRTERPFLSGCALSLLLYKPPLLLLLLPMLLFTKRFRTLGGFCLGGSVLGLLSIMVIGISGIHSYFDMLTSFARIKATGARQTWLEVDAYSFFFALTHNKRFAGLLFAALALAVLPALVVAWRKARTDAWALAITWTLVLNFYVLIYDSALIVIAAMLFIASRPPTRTLRWLLVILFLIPWIELPASRDYGFQLMTLALLALGCYQLLPNPTSVTRA